MTVLFYL